MQNARSSAASSNTFFPTRALYKSSVWLASNRKIATGKMGSHSPSAFPGVTKENVGKKCLKAEKSGVERMYKREKK